MHPDVFRELTAQRGREMRAEAQHAQLARAAARITRSARRGRVLPEQTDGFVMPAVPDYVDGSFRSEPAGRAEIGEIGAHDTGVGEAVARHAA